jgi:hypothetical protein
MAIDQDGGGGQEARKHTHTFASVDADGNETLPDLAIALGRRAQAAEKTGGELEDFLDHHAYDDRFRRGSAAIDQRDVLKIAIVGVDDAGAFIEFGRIQEVEDGEVLHGEDTVHAFQTEAAPGVEEIGNMSLFETGARGEFHTGQFAQLHLLVQALAKIVLKHFELHCGAGRARERETTTAREKILIDIVIA